MWLGSRVDVVVPAWNEAPRIARVLRGIPDWVDGVVVVDDASEDQTPDVVRGLGDIRIQLVVHARNRGVGAAIAAGYRKVMARPGGRRDVLVVMAGDGQMDPVDLPALVTPVAQGEADYVKGDRFHGPGSALDMPLVRQVGGRVLSIATSWALGQRVSDSQCGYAALAREACETLDLDALWPRYGYPNDLLSQLHLRGWRIAQAPVRAVYADEVSRLRARHVPIIAGLIARAWLRRVGR